MAIITTDSFNRVNSTTTLGSTDNVNGGTSTFTWSSATTYGINSNQAQKQTGAASSNSGAWINPNVSDFAVSVTFATLGNHPRLAFRGTDDTNCFFVLGNGTTNYQIIKRAASVNTVLASITVVPTAGDVIKVTCSGSSITVTINGANSTSVTNTFNQTSTQVGFISDDSIGRFDNFELDDLNTGTTYTGGGTSAGVGSASDTNTFISATTTYPGGGASTGSASTSDTNHLILAGSGTAVGVGSASDTNTMQVPTTYSGGGVSSGLASLSDHCIMVMVASGTATGVADAEFFKFSFSPPPECMITSQILNYTQSFPVIIQDAVGATTTIINVTPDANGYFQIVLPMEEVRVMVLINGKLYLDRYIWALDGESRLPIINYR